MILKAMVESDKSKPFWASSITKLKESAFEDVAEDSTLEIELFALALASGINDATTFPDYSLFVSNQTGNTVLLAVGALGIDGERKYLSNIGFSLGLFIAGGICFGQLGDSVGRRKRWWLVTTNLIQTALVFTAAALRHWYAFGSTGARAWSVICLLAFASGGQVAMARTVNVPEITTAMVTSAYIDFVVDPRIFKRSNRGRDRRFIFILSLIVGSFIGASCYRYVSASLALLLAAVIRFFVSFVFCLNKAVKKPQRQDTEVVEQSQPV